MCLIKVTIHRSQKPRRCVDCHGWIEIGERYMRLFGMATSTDPPYEVFEHIKCLDGTPDVRDGKKILAVLRDAGYTYDMNHKNVINIREVEPTSN